MKWFCLLLLCSSLNGWSQINKPIELSVNLLHAVSAHSPTTPILNEIANLNVDSLPHLLPTDNHKMAFWINLFNAFTQIRLSNDTSLFLRSRAFWKQRDFEVAGQAISLHQIYHGLLRHSKKTGSGGKKNKWFPSKFEKANRVQEVNPQIHFALNSGDINAPFILVYTENNILHLLSLITKNHLQKLNVNTSNRLILPQFMQAFIFDFEQGGGINKFILNNGISATQAALPSHYLPSLTQLHLNNFWID